MIHFVCAGPGAPDLITLRGAELLRRAGLVVYAGSLVNPKLLELTPKGCEICDSATMTLEQVLEKLTEGEKKGVVTVRLHTGDPSVYGAIREQMDRLKELGIAYEVVPGVSSFCAAAAAVGAEYTLPGVSQTVIPAHLPEAKLDEVKTYAAMAYTALNCEGLARCDFFVEKNTGRVLINEINTFPGFTAISMYPKLMEHEGLPVPQLIDRLIALAVERTEKQHG